MKGSAAVGRNVCIVGGGNAAIDAARTALRLGADSVRVLYRRTRDEMPAYAEEVEEACREGVLLEFLTVPFEVVSQNGGMCGVRCRRMELGEFDRSGRKRPVPGGTEYIIEADQLILAIGQSLDPVPILDGTAVETGGRNFIAADPVTGQTSVQWVFAGGDAVSGPASVVDAVAGGEKGAVGMDLFLTGQNHAFWREDRAVDTYFDPDEDPVEYKRSVVPLISPARRKGNFHEIELGWKEPVALREAKRCLRCDFRENCL
jgi:NADH-quinone oxidoreductase subunit F